MGVDKDYGGGFGSARPLNSNVGNANANNGAFNSNCNNEWSNTNGVRLYYHNNKSVKFILLLFSRKALYKSSLSIPSLSVNCLWQIVDNEKYNTKEVGVSTANARNAPEVLAK